MSLNVLTQKVLFWNISIQALSPMLWEIFAIRQQSRLILLWGLQKELSAVYVKPL